MLTATIAYVLRVKRTPMRGSTAPIFKAGSKQPEVQPEAQPEEQREGQREIQREVRLQLDVSPTAKNSRWHSVAGIQGRATLENASHTIEKKVPASTSSDRKDGGTVICTALYYLRVRVYE